jgi:sulfate adenylyltransferase
VAFSELGSLKTVTDHLISPHGGTLINLEATEERASELRALSVDWPSWDLTERQICDLELLVSGGFSPLTGFMTKDDYERVCAEMRLKDGTLWPIPITLDVTEQAAETLTPGQMLALRDPEGVMLAALHVEDIWRPDLTSEASDVFGTTSPEHPGVGYLLNRSNPVYVGGRVESLQPPVHYDFRSIRQTPAELRAEFARRGWTQIVAFQTRNPLHRAHVELTMRAAAESSANLLIHPVVGMTKPGDVDHYTRVRCYQAVLTRYPHNTAALALLPLAMRMGGPARPSGTRSSARTTAAPTSLSDGTMPDPVRIRRGSPSTDRTTPSSSSPSTRTSSEWRWSTSA